MNRRTVLRTTGTLTALGLAGCLSSGGDVPSPTEPADPVVDSTAVETAGTDCGSGGVGVASLEADAEAHRLTVSGTLGASNPCYLAELVETTLENETLSLTVGTERDGSDACADCVGAVDYEATVELTAGFEAEVVVSHESFDEIEEVRRGTVQL